MLSMMHDNNLCRTRSGLLQSYDVVQQRVIIRLQILHVDENRQNKYYFVYYLFVLRIYTLNNKCL